MPISRAAMAVGAPPVLSALWPPAAAIYPLTGVAAWLVWRRIDIGVERKRAALRRWGWQLLLGAFWPAALYGAAPALAIALLAALLAAAAATWAAFRHLETRAALLMALHLGWLLCAVVLTTDRFWPWAI